MTPEGKIAAYLVKRCKEYGFHQRKLSYEGRRGAPDRMIITDCGIAFVELKAPGQKPRVEQRRELALLELAGQMVFVCDSASSVEEMLEKIWSVVQTERMIPRCR